MAVFLAGTIALAPARLAAGVALALLGIVLLTDSRARAAGRDIGLVLLALSFETLWTSRLLGPLHVFVGWADARVCAFLLGLLGIEATAHANVVDTASTNFGISIWPYCASSFPLAGVSLAFLVMCLYLGRAPRRRDLPLLCLSLVGSVLLTEIRLVLLALNQASYQWWHFGPGMSVYAVAALALAVVFPILATRDPKTAVTVAGHRPPA